MDWTIETEYVVIIAVVFLFIWKSNLGLFAVNVNEQIGNSQVTLIEEGTNSVKFQNTWSKSSTPETASWTSKAHFRAETNPTASFTSALNLQENTYFNSYSIEFAIPPTLIIDNIQLIGQAENSKARCKVNKMQNSYYPSCIIEFDLTCPAEKTCKALIYPPITKTEIYGTGTAPPISICGNGVIEPGEECDGNDLNEQTCIKLGYLSGSLTCELNCVFNTFDCET